LTVVYRSTALMLLIAGSLMSQGPINTIPSWDGAEFIASFGVPDTATYGQTINIAPGSASVASFGFEIGNCTANVALRGEVYAWDGTKAIGASLFESPVTVVNASNSFQLVLFSTPGLILPPGNYVIFATTSRDQSGAPAAGCRYGSVDDTAYPAGLHVYLNNGTDVSQWTSGAWPTLPLDLAFQVNLAPPPPPPPTPAGVPAASPATLLLGFAGVIALGLLGLYRLRTAG
jgi:hypothetical protein